MITFYFVGILDLYFLLSNRINLVAIIYVGVSVLLWATDELVSLGRGWVN